MTPVTIPGGKVKGWWLDHANARLAAVYAGTQVFRVNASGLTTAGSEIVNSVVQTAGLAANSVTAAKLSANLGKGHIPLPLGSWRLIASNEIPPIAVASGGSGMLASDTAPKLSRINTSTDKGERILWAASSSVEITNQFVYPADLDDTLPITVNMLMGMAGAIDTPTVAVSFWEGVGDTNAGGNTAALAAAVAQVSVSILGTDVGAYPKTATVTLIPGAHTTDAAYLYGAWVEYTRKS